MRRGLMYIALAAIAALAVLSIIAAFFGAELAAALFNSPPLAAFWGLWAVLLIAGLVVYPRLVLRPGALAVHLGALLVLLGAMWGSQAGHDLADRLFGRRKAPEGTMRIFEGQTTSAMHTPDGKTVDLPFSIQLRDFRIEHYPVEGPGWDLVVVVPQPHRHEGHDPAAHEGAAPMFEPVEARVPWGEGETLDLPMTDTRAEVLRYIPRARAVRDAGRLRIETATGETTTLPAEVGAEAALSDPVATLRVVETFRNLKVVGGGRGRRVVDMGGEPLNPAMRVAIERPGREVETRFVMAYFDMHGQPDDRIRLSYDPPRVLNAEPDPAADTPAMLVRLADGDRRRDAWLAPAAGERFAWIALWPDDPPPAPGAEVSEARLYLFESRRMPKDYFSDLAVVENSGPVLRKTIEVNDPLHYGGYHFYQASYDKAPQPEFTVLSVVSDRGLLAVYVGFALVVGGAFWICWVTPAWKAFAGRRADGR